MVKFNEYYTPMEHCDETAYFEDCFDCGETYAADSMVNTTNGYRCQECHSDYVDAENLEYAKECFGSAVLAKIFRNPKGVSFICGLLTQWITDNSTEDQLDEVRKIINDSKVPHSA